MPLASRPIGAARPLAIVSALLATVFLAACAASGTNRAVVTVAGQDEIPMEVFLNQGYCPPVQVRAGAESIVVHERGHEGDAAFIRYQGSIGETARECRVLGPDTLSIKVGVAGRLTAGPKGGPGSTTLPVRIAVVKQGGAQVLFSQAVNVQVTITGSPYSADFMQVLENINLTLGPQDRDLIVYVGFDEGPPKPKA